MVRSARQKCISLTVVFVFSVTMLSPLGLVAGGDRPVSKQETIENDMGHLLNALQFASSVGSPADMMRALKWSSVNVLDRMKRSKPARSYSEVQAFEEKVVNPLRGLSSLHVILNMCQRLKHASAISKTVRSRLIREFQFSECSSPHAKTVKQRLKNLKLGDDIKALGREWDQIGKHLRKGARRASRQKILKKQLFQKNLEKLIPKYLYARAKYVKRWNKANISPKIAILQFYREVFKEESFKKLFSDESVKTHHGYDTGSGYRAFRKKVGEKTIAAVKKTIQKINNDQKYWNSPTDNKIQTFNHTQRTLREFHLLQKDIKKYEEPAYRAKAFLRHIGSSYSWRRREITPVKNPDLQKALLTEDVLETVAPQSSSRYETYMPAHRSFLRQLSANKKISGIPFNMKSSKTHYYFKPRADGAEFIRGMVHHLAGRSDRHTLMLSDVRVGGTRLPVWSDPKRKSKAHMSQQLRPIFGGELSRKITSDIVYLTRRELKEYHMLDSMGRLRPIRSYKDLDKMREAVQNAVKGTTLPVALDKNAPPLRMSALQVPIFLYDEFRRRASKKKKALLGEPFINPRNFSVWATHKIVPKHAALQKSLDSYFVEARHLLRQLVEWERNKKPEDFIKIMIKANPSVVAEVLMDHPRDADLVCQMGHEIPVDEAMDRYKEAWISVVGLGVLFGATVLSGGLLAASHYLGATALRSGGGVLMAAVGIGTSARELPHIVDRMIDFQDQHNFAFRAMEVLDQDNREAIKALEKKVDAALFGALLTGLLAPLDVFSMFGHLKAIARARDAQKLQQAKQALEHLSSGEVEDLLLAMKKLEMMADDLAPGTLMGGLHLKRGGAVNHYASDRLLRLTSEIPPPKGTAARTLWELEISVLKGEKTQWTRLAGGEEYSRLKKMMNELTEAGIKGDRKKAIELKEAIVAAEQEIDKLIGLKKAGDLGAVQRIRWARLDYAKHQLGQALSRSPGLGKFIDDAHIERYSEELLEKTLDVLKASNIPYRIASRIPVETEKGIRFVKGIEIIPAVELSQINLMAKRLGVRDGYKLMYSPELLFRSNAKSGINTKLQHIYSSHDFLRRLQLDTPTGDQVRKVLFGFKRLPKHPKNTIGKTAERLLWEVEEHILLGKGFDVKHFLGEKQKHLRTLRQYENLERALRVAKQKENRPLMEQLKAILATKGGELDQVIGVKGAVRRIRQAQAEAALNKLRRIALEASQSRLIGPAQAREFGDKALNEAKIYLDKLGIPNRVVDKIVVDNGNLVRGLEIMPAVDASTLSLFSRSLNGKHNVRLLYSPELLALKKFDAGYRKLAIGHHGEVYLSHSDLSHLRATFAGIHEAKHMIDDRLLSMGKNHPTYVWITGGKYPGLPRGYRNGYGANEMPAFRTNIASTVSQIRQELRYADHVLDNKKLYGLVEDAMDYTGMVQAFGKQTREEALKMKWHIIDGKLDPRSLKVTTLPSSKKAGKRLRIRVKRKVILDGEVSWREMNLDFSVGKREYGRFVIFDNLVRNRKLKDAQLMFDRAIKPRLMNQLDWLEGVAKEYHQAYRPLKRVAENFLSLHDQIIRRMKTNPKYTPSPRDLNRLFSYLKDVQELSKYRVLTKDKLAAQSRSFGLR